MTQPICDEIFQEVYDKYKDIPGIIEIKIDDFLGDEIIIVINKNILKDILPQIYKGVRIIAFDVYENYKDISNFLDDLIVNEFSLWEKEYDVGLRTLFSLCKSYKNIITNYERKQGLI